LTKKQEYCDSEEKVSALMAKTGFLPEEIDQMSRLLKATRDILHFYLNEFGLHLEKEQQAELGKLSSKSDVLVLKISRLGFEARALETEAKKSIETKKDFVPEQKKIETIKQEISTTKKDLLELNQRITTIVEKMKELPREE
jgi:phosphoribosylaminoimidazole-succinocarboxamide synthase